MTSPHRALDFRGASLALLLSALWGGNPVAIKIGLHDAGPFTLGWVRFVLGGLSILAWAWWTGALKGFRIEPHEWRPLGVLGLLFTIQIGLMNLGTDLTSASHSAVLLLAIGYQGIVVAGFNFIANLWLLKRHRPSALAGFWLTSPIFGVLLSALFAGDPLTGALLLASVLVAIGIGLAGRGS